MIMKKLFLLAILTFVTSVTFAQDLSWNVKAGMNMSSMSKVDDSKMKIGFNAGVGATYAFDETWSVRPSLLFTTKGVKQDYDGEKITCNPMYIELPVMGAVSFPISEGINLVVSTGPYFAYGIGGKAKFGDEKIDLFGDGEDKVGYKRFDCGWGAGITAEFGKFFVGVNGEFGITKVMDGDESPKNSNFSIGIGLKL